MARPSEEISKSNVRSAGKPDSNLANDSNHLGGIPADEYLTKNYYDQHMEKYEQDQKKYIDEQDTKNLKAAKDYTDLKIKNQDFSSFAEVKDLQTLDDNLSKKIEDCHTNCANELKTKTDAIVKDVNDNFTNVEKKITELSNGQNELFQSVSDGKKKIAEAITDKGVTTSANDTFDTMAGNIRNIQTGGGEIPEGYVNTNDANATSSDLLLGKTAYAKGNKLVGNLNLYDANATPDKIASGYTAYVGSGKITGTMDMKGTATPYDILQGKTAWVNGQKIEGLLDISSFEQPSYNIGDVEKIYGTAVGDMIYDYEAITGANASSISSATTRPTALLKRDNEDEPFGRINFEADSNSKTISIVTYLKSDSGLYKGQWTNKKTYTLQDLGITNDNSTVYSSWSNIELRAFYKDDNNMYLMIAFEISSSSVPEINMTRYIYKLKILEEQAEEYSSRSATPIIERLGIDVTHKWKYSDTRERAKCITILFSNNNSSIFYELSESFSGGLTTNYGHLVLKRMILDEIKEDLDLTTFGTVTTKFSQTLNIIETFGSSAESYCTYKPHLITMKFKNDERIIEVNANMLNTSPKNKIIFVLLDEDGNYITNFSKETYIKTSNNITEDNAHSGDYGAMIVNFDCTELDVICTRKVTTETNEPNSIILCRCHYDIYTDYNNNTMTFTKDDNKYIEAIISNIPFLYNRSIYKIITDITNVNGLLITADSAVNYNFPNEKINICNINYNNPMLINIKSEGTNDVILSKGLDITDDYKCFYLSEDISYSSIGLSTYISVNDFSTIVALLYNGEYYYKKDSASLTAGVNDVIKGKTFIGRSGSPERGTLEWEV